MVEDFRDLGHSVGFEEADRLQVRLRPSPMRRALRNLIENALKYGKSAEVTLTATLSVPDRSKEIPAASRPDGTRPET
ncbi:hypothetical protein [Salmonella enterica]|uniref:hypothetical protein n=1 Tax=Salmonella enterica TaxID=28901 RepID=UPI001CA5A071|nr:hypothetical protein [Salmonella enterica]